MDLSHLDKKYFIDSHIFNCPFCKRNNVSYSITGCFSFDWGKDKICYGYIIKCDSEGCQKESLHLSFEELRDSYFNYGQIKYRNFFDKAKDIDSKLFFSQPSSCFVVDNRIPEKIRKLIYEAENSRKSNFLVGSSACLRKAIYELLEHEKTIVKNKITGYANYKESIKNLKKSFPKVEDDLIDALGDIQGLASDNIHEGSWEAWDSRRLQVLTELVKTVLYEIYVIPEEKKERLGVLSQIKTVFSSSKNEIKEEK